MSWSCIRADVRLVVASVLDRRRGLEVVELELFARPIRFEQDDITDDRPRIALHLNYIN